MVANNNIIVPKLILNKTEIDYCSASPKAKEFVISLYIGDDIKPSDSLLYVNVAFAYNKNKVIIDMPLLMGTISEQFSSHCTSIWDEFDYTYNYYNFQAYNILKPVYGEEALPLISFKGRYVTADTIDETDFSIAVLEFAEEFKREYVVGNEDTIKLYSRPVEKEDRIISIKAEKDTFLFDGSINKEDTVLVNYSLDISELKHFENFELEFRIDSLAEEFEIFDFEINDNFSYELIEKEKTKLIFNIKKQDLIDNLTEYFCKLLIKNLNNKNKEDTIRTVLYSNIKNINKSSCSMFTKLDTIFLVSNKIKDGSISIIDNNIEFEYNELNYKLLINLCNLSDIYIYDVYGHQMQINPRILNQGIEIDLSNLCSGIYFVELKSLDNKIYRKKLTIN